MQPANSNENSSHTSNESPPNPRTPVYEEIQDLQAARTRHPQKRSLGEAADLAADYTITQCPAYATTHTDENTGV